MFVLFANGPALWPQPASSAGEWFVWGACMSVAAVLGGWGILNRNRPGRDTPVGVALLITLVLVVAASLFSTDKSHERQMEQNRIEREQRDRENGGPLEFRPPY